MKIKVTLEKLSSPGFIGGFRTLRKSRFGCAEAWAIYRAGEQIDRELERYVAIRKEIEDRFARTDGKVKFVPTEAVAAFQREIQNLGAKEVELLLDHKVTLSDDCQIGPDEIGALVEAGVIDPPNSSAANETRDGSGDQAPPNSEDGRT